MNVGRIFNFLKQNIIVSVMAYALFSGAHVAYAGQCDDGIDNDGDGKIDALVELSPTNTETFNFASSYLIVQFMKSQGVNIPSPDPADFRGDSVTATRVCNLKGYRTGTVTSTSSFHSCENNWIAYYNASTNTYPYFNSCNSNVYMQTLRCTSRLAQCSDGIDNDGDGLIDFPQDTGCVSANDDSERPHDPKCTAPTSPTEFEQCRDGNDNDGDGLVDLNDPGCSSPSDDDELNAAPAGSVTLRTECVTPNRDGSYTAYFGYQNTSSSPITINDVPAQQSLNYFSPTPGYRGQPTTFQPGLNKGAFPLVFDGFPVTWTIKQPGSSVTSSATASSNTAICGTLQPVAECVSGVVGGGTQATFGYINSNDFPLVMPVGTNNFFSPGDANRGQPTLFLAGTVASVFKVPFSGSLTWTLNSKNALATTSLPVCPTSACTGTSVVGVKSTLDDIAVAFADLTVQAANYLAQNPSLNERGRINAQIDAKRAAKKANAFVVAARNLLLQFPEVVNNCPLTPGQVCSSIDRQDIINKLADLYRHAYSASRRITQRGNFNTTGKTNRMSKLIKEAKVLNAAGQKNIESLPRFATECA